MSKFTSAALVLLLVTLSVCAVCVTWELHLTNQSARASMVAVAHPTIGKDADDAVKDGANEMRDITIAVLKPCKAGKPETCGLLPAIRQVVQDSGSAVRTMQQQVAETQPLIQNAAQAIQSSSEHLNKTVDAATELTVALTGDADAAKPTIEAGKPLLTDFDSILKDNATQFHDSLVHFDSMSASGDKMLADAQWKEHQLLHPDKVKLTFWTGSEAALEWIHKYVIPSVSLF